MVRLFRLEKREKRSGNAVCKHEFVRRFPASLLGRPPLPRRAVSRCKELSTTRETHAAETDTNFRAGITRRMKLPAPPYMPAGPVQPNLWAELGAARLCWKMPPPAGSAALDVSRRAVNSALLHDNGVVAQGVGQTDQA